MYEQIFTGTFDKNYTYIYHLSIISIKYNIIFETFKINLYTDISNNNKIYHMQVTKKMGKREENKNFCLFKSKNVRSVFHVQYQN